MKIILDTHIFLWLIDNDNRLKTQWLNEIKNPNNELDYHGTIRTTT